MPQSVLTEAQFQLAEFLFILLVLLAFGLWLSTVATKVAERAGGYTRIIKLGRRPSDDAEMAFIELVDFDENMAKTEAKKTRTRRSRKAAPKAETPAEAPAEVAKEEAPAEAPAAEAEAPAAEASAE